MNNYWISIHFLLHPTVPSHPSSQTCGPETSTRKRLLVYSCWFFFFCCTSSLSLSIFPFRTKKTLVKTQQEAKKSTSTQRLKEFHKYFRYLPFVSHLATLAASGKSSSHARVCRPSLSNQLAIAGWTWLGAFLPWRSQLKPWTSRALGCLFWTFRVKISLSFGTPRPAGPPGDKEKTSSFSLSRSKSAFGAFRRFA